MPGLPLHGYAWAGVPSTEQRFKAKYAKEKYKTEPCKHMQMQGLCPWGEECFFSHSEDDRIEIEKKIKRYKTELWSPLAIVMQQSVVVVVVVVAVCSDFALALAVQTLRIMCSHNMLMEGFCWYGSRCIFAHSDKELRYVGQTPEEDALLEATHWVAARAAMLVLEVDLYISIPFH